MIQFDSMIPSIRFDSKILVHVWRHGREGTLQQQNSSALPGFWRISRSLARSARSSRSLVHVDLHERTRFGSKLDSNRIEGIELFKDGVPPL